MWSVVNTRAHLDLYALHMFCSLCVCVCAYALHMRIYISLLLMHSNLYLSAHSAFTEAHRDAHGTCGTRAGQTTWAHRIGRALGHYARVNRARAHTDTPTDTRTSNMSFLMQRGNASRTGARNFDYARSKASHTRTRIKTS